MGYVGNNGNYDVTYQASRGQRQGGVGMSSFADFDLAHDHINSYEQGSKGGVYTVQSGDTLQGIAAALWGDASLWYKIAEVNGLTASSTLIEGQPLLIPVGVQRNENNAATYQPYDPLEVLGNTSPTSPKPKTGGCGVMGQVLLVVIAVVVSVFTAGAALAAMGAASSIGAGMLTVMSGGLLTAAGSTATAVAIGAAAGAAGSIVSQGVGVATGIQDKFSWNAVALAAIGGGIGAGTAAPTNWQGAVTGAIANNVLTQRIGTALGLQDKFSWAGVAAAGVGAGVGFSVNQHFGGALSNAVGDTLTRGIVGGASAIASAATRSLMNGGDFGDNIMAALPDVIGQTIGDAIAGGISGQRSVGTKAPSVSKQAPQTAKEVAELHGCEVGGVMWSLDARPQKGVTDKQPAPVADLSIPPLESEEIVVTGHRSLLARLRDWALDTVGADGQTFYDGRSPHRTFSWGGLAEAGSDASAFMYEYNPLFNPYFNMRGDAARTYSAFGAAVLDIFPAIGRGFDEFVNGSIVGEERAEWWAHGIRQPQPEPPSLGEVAVAIGSELTLLPTASRMRDRFQNVERLSAAGDDVAARAEAQAFMREGAVAALAFTKFARGTQAVSAESNALRTAELAAARHSAWGSSLDDVSATVERLGARALRNSQGNWVESERLFGNYIDGVNNRLVRGGSDLTVRVQVAAKEGEMVQAFIVRGGRRFPTPGSARLDAGITSLANPANKHGLRPVVAGFDITLNQRKPNIVPWYQKHFGQIPVYDIRLPP